MGELRAYLKNLKADYRGGLRRSFEDMAMHMFMCELGLDAPPLRHVNQKGIEADPIDLRREGNASYPQGNENKFWECAKNQVCSTDPSCSQMEVDFLYHSGRYAFQAKFFDEGTDLSTTKRGILSSIRDAKTYGVTDLYLYINKDLGQNLKKQNQNANEKSNQNSGFGAVNEQQLSSRNRVGRFHRSEHMAYCDQDYRNSFQKEIESEADGLDMKVHWRTADRIENLLVKPEYDYIRKVYLSNEEEPDIFGYYMSVIKKVCECNEEDSLYGNISLLDGYIEPKIRDRRSGSPSRSNSKESLDNRGDCQVVREYLESWVREKSEWISIFCGEPGHGKTSLCQKAVYDFYVGKWLAGTVKNVICISINPAGSKAEEEIRTSGTFSFESLLSWEGEDAARSKGSQEIRKKDLQNALLFLDGFDELLEWLPGYGMDKFLQTVSKYLYDGFKENAKPHIIITTRKMAISDDKKYYRDYEYKKVIPIWELQFIEEGQQYGWIRRHSRKLHLDSWNVEKESYINRYQEMYVGLKNNDKDDRELKDILGVPIIFRMIVAGGYIPKRGSHPATIYDELFRKTWVRHNVRESHYYDSENRHCKWVKNLESVKRILSRHALRVYADNGDSAEINGNIEGAASSWIYAFYTKFKEGDGDSQDVGRKYRIGFLHKSFYEYFLAYEILGWFRDCGKDERIVVSGGENVGFVDMLFVLGKQKLSEEVLKSIKNLYEMIQKSDWYESIGKTGFEVAYKIAKQTGGILSLTQHTEAYFSRHCQNKEYGRYVAQIEPDFRESIWKLLLDMSALFEKEEADLKGGIVDLDCKRNKGDCTAELQMYVFDSLKRGENAFWNILSICSVCGHPLEYGSAYERCFRAYDLKGIHLENAKLRGAFLRGACLQGAHLEGADIEGAHLESAILSGAHLESAHLFGANLEAANLSGAYLIGAYLVGINLKHANLQSSHCEKADMRGAVLEGAVLNDAHLEGATLASAYLDEVTYDEINKICRGTSVGKFAWTSIHLAGDGLKADLKGAFLSPEQVKEVINIEALEPSEIPDNIVIEKTSGKENVRIFVTRGKKTKCIDLSEFGHYCQEKDQSKKPLSWRLLRIENNKALIITEKLIDCRSYHNTRNDVTWAESQIRKWLNHDFLNAAFTDEERGSIISVCNQNSNCEGNHAFGGVPTWDSIFLLSIDESCTYFRTDLDRRATPTPYAKMQRRNSDRGYRTSDDEETGWWWLRSLDYSDCLAALVYDDGGIHEHGHRVVDRAVFVRPALWLNL